MHTKVPKPASEQKHFLIKSIVAVYALLACVIVLNLTVNSPSASAANQSIPVVEEVTVDSESTPAEQLSDSSSSSLDEAQMGEILSAARASGRDVMVVFGAQWCDRCALLKRYMADSPLQNRINQQFIVVYVDVGDWDEARRHETQMGHPTREGLPAVVIAHANEELVSIMNSDELVTFLPDRDQPIYDWMERVLQYAEQVYASR